jgi:hypothetical protein
MFLRNFRLSPAAFCYNPEYSLFDLIMPITVNPQFSGANGGGGGIIRISEARGSPKRHKNLRTQINRKCNDISSADESK